MRSRLGKVGMLMLVLVMAVGAMGAGFAAFTDEMIVQGTVSTATVDYEVQCLSGTWVYKDMTTGFARTAIVDHLQWCVPDPKPALRADPPYKLISSAEPSWNGQMLSINFDNIFPCIDFCADVVLHYTGSIPAHIMLDDFVWTAGSELAPFMDVQYFYWAQGGVPNPTGGFVPVELEAVQLHYCDLLMIVFCLHIPQDNDLQGMSGAFDTKLTMFQWNEADEPCGPEVVLIQEGGTEWPAWDKGGPAVRWKGANSGGEFYLGEDDLGVGANRVEAEYGYYAAATKTYDLEFSFNKVTGNVYGKISDPGAGDPTVVLNRLLVGSSAGLNGMQIIVQDSMADSGVALRDVMLNGMDLGDFGVLDKPGTIGRQAWNVTGFDFDQDWTITAKIDVDGYNGNESMKVEFNVGTVV